MITINEQQNEQSLIKDKEIEGDRQAWHLMNQGLLALVRHLDFFRMPQKQTRASSVIICLYSWNKIIARVSYCRLSGRRALMRLLTGWLMMPMLSISL